MKDHIKSYWQNYIDGAYCDGGAGCINVINPGTGKKLAEHALADAADVNRAVKAARRVQQSGELSDLPPVERGRMVQEMGRYLHDHVDEISKILTLEQGKPLYEARTEVEEALEYFEFFGNAAGIVEGRSVPLGKHYFDFTVNEPHGVSAQIIPSNFPMIIAARSLSAGLVTGNSCVIKTSDLTPICSEWFSRAAEAAGLPVGAINILCGLGKDAGFALTTHPFVNQIVFTGHVETGIAIAREAAKNLIPCLLELGGNAAAIVYEDADLDNFLKFARNAAFLNSGQFCTALSRLIIHENYYDEVVDRVTDIAKSLSVGPGIDQPEFGPYMGAMTCEKQCGRVESMICEAQKEGANLVFGGARLSMPGTFMKPTVLTDVSSNMKIAQEAISGPVALLMRFKEEAEAIRIANDTQYGLQCVIFTRDISRATRSAYAIRAGHIPINEWFIGPVETALGGIGKSGNGSVKGREALWNYVKTKNILIPIH